MITLHHLDHSRSTRVLWLLEELQLDFQLVRYQRDAQMRAPGSLKAIHPLGKSPVLVDGALVLAESSAILRYLNTRYGGGTLTPPPGSDAFAIHEEWLDYVEGSAALPIMLTLLGGMTGGLSDKLKAFAEPELRKTLAYIAAGIGDKPFLTGPRLTLADIQMVYLLGTATRAGLLADQPVIAAYFERLQQQPGYLKAVAKGGPMMPPAR